MWFISFSIINQFNNKMNNNYILTSMEAKNNILVNVDCLLINYKIK